jgi:hypothetical protein
MADTTFHSVFEFHCKNGLLHSLKRKVNGSVAMVVDLGNVHAESLHFTTLYVHIAVMTSQMSWQQHFIKWGIWKGRRHFHMPARLK